MTDPDADVVALLDRLARTVPDQVPPVTRLVAAARRSRRRRTGLVVAAATIAVALVAASGLVARSLGQHQPAAPAAPPGMRLVGVGRVVVAVPSTWIDDQPVCGPPDAAYVVFQPSRMSGGSCMPRSPVDRPMSLGLSLVRDWPGGAPALGTQCAESPRGWCQERWRVSAQGVQLAVEYRRGDASMLATLRRIRASTAVLPAGYTTVPALGVVHVGANLSPVQLLERAGLVATGVRPDRDVVGFDPVPGTVLPTGSQVTVLYTPSPADFQHPVPPYCSGTTAALLLQGSTLIDLYPAGFQMGFRLVGDRPIQIERSGPCAGRIGLRFTTVTPQGSVTVDAPGDDSPFRLPPGPGELTLIAPGGPFRVTYSVSR